MKRIQSAFAISLAVCSALVARAAEDKDARPATGRQVWFAASAIPDDVENPVKVQDLASFKGGDYLFLNLTKLNVAVQMGSNRTTIKPGQTSISRAPDLNQAATTPVIYHFYHPERDRWLLITASTVARIPTRREICVFSWDNQFERLDYHGITFPVEQ